MQFILTCLAFLLPLVVICQDEIIETETIAVHFDYTKPCEGQILISCFQNGEHFLNSDKAVYSEVIACQDSILIEGLNPDSSRAIVAFVDINKNKELDLNFFGIPTEPYAMSNGFRGKWREPIFEDTAESPDTKVINLKFMFWKER